MRFQLKYINYLLLCLFVSCFEPVFSQNTENSLDQLYVPSEGSIFNDDSDNGDGAGNYREHKNVIFFNPFLLVRSIGSLHYQRNFGEYFAAYVGIGSAYRKDFVMRLGYESSSEFFDNEYQEHGIYDIMNDGELQSSVNPFLNFGLKLYYDSFWGFDYGYLGVDYRYVNQNIDYTYSQYFNGNGGSSSYTLSEDFEIGVANHNLNFLFGFESSSSGKIGVFHSLYWGFGVRSTIYDEITTTVTSDLFNNTIEEVGLSGNKARFLSGSLLLGYKFGIGW